MTDTLSRAKTLLEQNDYTCVLILEDSVHTDTRRGVTPLLACLDSNDSYIGASAADKVVGAGAAYLYVLLGVKELYAAVISEKAKEIISSNGIELETGEVTAHIRNRAGTGMCPIEAAVSDAVDAFDALCRIRYKLKELSEEK